MLHRSSLQPIHTVAEQAPPDSLLDSTKPYSNESSGLSDLREALSESPPELQNTAAVYTFVQPEQTPDSMPWSPEAP
jgi:hypothetical protein